MVRPVREGERVVGKLNDVGAAANGIKLTRSVEVVDEGDLVDGNTAGMQIAHAFENSPMRWTVEVLGLQLQHDLLQNVGVEHACGKNRFLGFDIAGDGLAVRVIWHVSVPLVGGMSRRTHP